MSDLILFCIAILIAVAAKLSVQGTRQAIQKHMQDASLQKRD